MVLKQKLIKWISFAVLFMGLTSFIMAQSVAKKSEMGGPRPKPGAAEAPVGRFQIVMNANVRADTFLLDTATGKTWVSTEFKNIENDKPVWLFRERLDDDAQFSDWSKRQTLKTKE